MLTGDIRCRRDSRSKRGTLDWQVGWKDKYPDACRLLYWIRKSDQKSQNVVDRANLDRPRLRVIRGRCAVHGPSSALELHFDRHRTITGKGEHSMEFDVIELLSTEFESLGEILNE